MWIIIAIDRRNLGRPHRGCGLDFRSSPPRVVLATKDSKIDKFERSADVDKIIKSIYSDESLKTEDCSSVNGTVLAKYRLMRLQIDEEGDPRP